MCTSSTSARTDALHDARLVTSPSASSALRSIMSAILHSWFMGSLSAALIALDTQDSSGSRPHAILGFRPEVGLESCLRRSDEAAKIRPCLARVDDVLDAERLRRAKRRGNGPQLGFELALAALGVGGRHDLAPKRRGDAALNRQRAPFR